MISSADQTTIPQDHVADDHPDWLAAREFLMQHAAPAEPPPQMPAAPVVSAIELRKMAMARFDEFVAEQGMPAKAVAAIQTSLEAVPLAGFTAFIRRAVDGLAKRGLYFGGMDDAAFASLDDPAQGQDYAQPDVQPSPAMADGAPVAGSDQPAGSSGDMGQLPPDAGGGIPDAAVAPELGGGAVAPVGDGSQPDAALTPGAVAPSPADGLLAQQGNDDGTQTDGTQIRAQENGTDGIAQTESEGSQDGLRQASPQDGSAVQGQEVGVDASGAVMSREWTAFTPDSQSKGVSRSEMPQIKSIHRGAMVNFLAARGITHEMVEVPAGELKPTQAEFSFDKVKQAKGFTGTDRSILISSDNYVLDGHHQWLSKLAYDEPVKAIQLSAPIDKLLEVIKEFPSATTDNTTMNAEAAPQPGAEAQLTPLDVVASSTQDSAAVPVDAGPDKTAALQKRLADLEKLRKAL